MNLRSLITSAADILGMAVKQNKSPDKLLSEIFRNKKYFGSKDRRFITELIFSSLRNMMLLKFLVAKLSDNENNTELKIVIINCCISSQQESTFGFNIEPLLHKLSSSIDELNNIINSFILKEYLFTSNELNNFNKNLFFILNNLPQPNLSNLESISNYYSMPLWIIEKISDNIDILNFAKNSIKSAPAFIRINKSKNGESIVEEYFVQNGIKKGMLSPAAYKFEGRLKLDDNDLFKSGLYEIQDEGSQLISYALSPSQNSNILDACAGAGGKSLHLADLTNDNATIIATDTEFGRLKEISKRAYRSGFKSITAKHIKSQDIDSLKKLFNYQMFDYVLVDAPCSGLGTIRRDPIRKFKVSEGLIKRLAEKQFRILSQYSQFVKKGGILVYSTCSVLKDENDNVIDKFLKENQNFVSDDLHSIFISQGIDIPELKEGSDRLTIAFDKYDNDGFFISRMIRIN